MFTHTLQGKEFVSEIRHKRPSLAKYSRLSDLDPKHPKISKKNLLGLSKAGLGPPASPPGAEQQAEMLPLGKPQLHQTPF